MRIRTGDGSGGRLTARRRRIVSAGDRGGSDALRRLIPFRFATDERGPLRPPALCGGPESSAQAPGSGPRTRAALRNPPPQPGALLVPG